MNVENERGTFQISWQEENVLVRNSTPTTIWLRCLPCQWQIELARLRDQRAKAKIAVRIDRLAQGHAGDVQPVGAGISELRIHFGPGYRVYFVHRAEAIIVLLCGGDKSSQTKDIKTAKALAADLED